MSPTIGVDVPLLPEHKVTEKRAASVSGAVFNVSTSIIGAGIMSIPATLKVLGVIPAFVLIVVIAWLADISVEFLMRYTYSGESKTYAGVMREAFGTVGSVAVQICVMITNLGCLIIYLIIIGDVLSGNVHEGSVHLGVLQEWFGIHWWNSRAFALFFIVVFVMLPLVSFRRVVHPIGFELGKPSDMISAVRISLVICAVIYFSIGIFGYLLFGESIMADILVNFDRSSDTASGALLNDMVRLSYALHLMLVFPLLNFSLRANIDEFLFPRKTLLAKDTTRFVSLTLIILIFTYLLAIAIPNIWYFFQFVGSTSAVCLAFIFPGAIVLRDTHRISTTKDRIIASTMIILAVEVPSPLLSSKEP
ncbi:hypothetical protein GH714_037514 [Hevea brasiliensis]|uniref:Amino acid transporter transmembrane domain-containing protein n=1 Tax=Hevea brasiliensis TaxID=3981 RepID=A0A6A6L5S2_HEVBR|nr:hypothetical protein GH714_037514 [Hevea brasiliensis]